MRKLLLAALLLASPAHAAWVSTPPAHQYGVVMPGAGNPFVDYSHATYSAAGESIIAPIDLEVIATGAMPVLRGCPAAGVTVDYRLAPAQVCGPVGTRYRRGDVIGYPLRSVLSVSATVVGGPLAGQSVNPDAF